MFSKSNLYKYLSVVSTVSLVLAGFFIVQMFIIFLLHAMLQSGLISGDLLESTLLQFVFSVLVYGLTLGFILGVYQSLYGPIKNKKTLLGFSRKPKISDIYFLLAGYGVYFVGNLAVFTFLTTFVPGFNFDEKQSVGFENINSQIEYVMAFVVLVVMAPLIEEAIFRGFLFTKVRKQLNFWPTAIVVSLIFGLVHLQWNVGVDVFVLSLVLCFVREKTNSIWAGVGIHMLKNCVAFMILFFNLA